MEESLPGRLSGPGDLSCATPQGDRLLHFLINGATEYALILISPDEKITYWNQGAERIFGYTRDEVIGRPFDQLFTPEDSELGISHKELQRARDQGWADDERWHCRRDGQRFWANGVVTSVRDDSGRLIGYSKILRDQTTRKLTEDRLKSSVAELTQFSWSVSHDLQEPLRMVASYQRLIEKHYRGKVDERFDELLKIATCGAVTLQRMVTDLLNYLREEQRECRFERADCSAIVDMAISNLKLAIEESKGVVTRASLPIVLGSSIQLMQIFQNLIGNALKYRRNGIAPTVYVDVSAGETEWTFSVGDDGIGMPADQKDRAFEPFRRLHSRQDYPGTGLGLSLCKKIVERHAGRIWIESETDRGTTVFFTIPRRLQRKEEPQGSVARHEPRNGAEGVG